MCSSDLVHNIVSITSDDGRRYDGSLDGARPLPLLKGLTPPAAHARTGGVHDDGTTGQPSTNGKLATRKIFLETFSRDFCS